MSFFFNTSYYSFYFQMSKIINFNMENECNAFVTEHKPLINGQPTNHTTEPSVNFVGRFAKEVLRFTDPRYSTLD